MKRRGWPGRLLAPCSASAGADPPQAADFLCGRRQWRIEKVAVVPDFVEQVGARFIASGEPHLVRHANGQRVPSAQFLSQELRRPGKR